MTSLRPQWPSAGSSPTDLWGFDVSLTKLTDTECWILVRSVPAIVFCIAQQPIGDDFPVRTLVLVLFALMMVCFQQRRLYWRSWGPAWWNICVLPVLPYFAGSQRRRASPRTCRHCCSGCRHPSCRCPTPLLPQFQGRWTHVVWDVLAQPTWNVKTFYTASSQCRVALVTQKSGFLN